MPIAMLLHSDGIGETQACMCFHIVIVLLILSNPDTNIQIWNKTLINFLQTLPGDATTTMCHRYTPPEQLRIFVKSADILVVATGTICLNI